MKKHLLILFSALLSLVASAQTKVEIDGIWYNLVSKDKQAEVSWGDTKYSGSITIPATVIHEGVNYSVTSIGSYAFAACSSLTTINIPEGVTSIENWAFYNCSSLTAITLPESVKSIEGDAFYYCKSLTTITIPEGSQLTSIGDNAFYDCSNLTTINIPENSQWTSIGSYAFAACSSLTTINIPEGVTSIGEGTFQFCTSLTTITLPESVTSIEYRAFDDCKSLTDVYCYAEGVPTTDTDAFINSNITNATLHIPANALNAYKTTAPWSSFGKFETTSIAVTGITLSQSSAILTEGESLTLIATVNPEDATDTSVTWSNSNPSVATVDGQGKVTALAPGTATITATATDGCGASASCKVEVVAAQQHSYTITFLVDGEVYHQEELEYGSAIVAPEAPTKEGYTFSGWSEVPETMPANDVIVTGTFTAEEQPEAEIIASGICGDSLTWALTEEYELVIEGTGAMYDYSANDVPWGDYRKSIQAVFLSEEMTSIGDYAFSNCTKLAAISIPESVTSIGYRAFYRCSKLATATITEYSQLTSIGYAAFESCSKLTDITIPWGVTSIGEYAFFSCKKLSSITCYAATPPTIGGVSTFYSVDKSIPVYVPDYAVEAYRSAKHWSEFTWFIGMETGINNSEIKNQKSDIIYDFHGRRITDTEGLKGIYIIDGRKVIIK